MKKEFFKIGAALLLLFALILAVWWRRKGAEETEKRTEKEQKIVRIDLDTVDRITVSPASGERVTFERRKKDAAGNFTDAFAPLSKEFDTVSDWMITEPARALPDSWTVQSLVQGLKDAASTKTVSEKGERAADYGLDPAVVKIELFESKAASPSLVVRVGEENPAHTSIYAQVSDSPRIVLIGKALDVLKTRKFSEWERKEIVGFKDIGAIGRVSVRSSGNGTLTAVKEKSGWRVTEPDKFPADRAAVETFLNELKALRASEVVSRNAGRDAAKYGLGRPFAVVSFADGDEKRELAVGKTGKGSLFVRRPGAPEIYSVSDESGSVAENLSPGRDKWTSKVPFDIGEEKIRSVTVSGKDGRTELLKKDGKWTMLRPLSDRLDEIKVSSLLSKLTSLKGSKILKGISSKKPAVMNIAVGSGQGKRTLQLFMADASKDLEGKSSDPPLTFAVSKGDYETLSEMSKASALRETRLIPGPRQELSSVEFESGKSKVSLTRNGKGEWVLKSVQEGDIKDADFPRNFIDAMGDLSLEVFLPGDPSEIGTASGKLKVGTKSGETFTWLLGKKDDHDRWVYSEERKIMGKIKKSFVERLETLAGFPVK